VARFGLMLQPDVSVNIESSNSNRTAAEPPNTSISCLTTPIGVLQFQDVDITESSSHPVDMSLSCFNDQSQESNDDTRERNLDKSESDTDSSTNTVSRQSQMNASNLQDEDYLPPFNDINNPGRIFDSAKFMITNTSM